MYSVSSAVKSALDNGAKQGVSLAILLANSTTLNLTEADIVADTFYIDRASASSGALPIGACASNELGFTLNNTNGRYNNVDFTNARIDVTLYVYVNGVRTLACEGGRYYIIAAPLTRKQIPITAYDSLTKCDVKNSRAGTGTYTVQLLHILQHCANSCFGSGTAIDYSAVSALASQYLYGFKYPSGDDVTYRMTIAWVAALCGAMARTHGNADAVQIIRRETTGITIGLRQQFDGTLEYAKAITLSGANLYDGGGNIYNRGNAGYTLEVSSNGIFEMAYNQSNGTDYRTGIATNLWNSLNGYGYTPFKANCAPMPYLECGDGVSFVDDFGTTRTSIVTHLRYKLNGVTIIVSSAENTTEHSINTSIPSAIARNSIESDMLKLDALKSINYLYTSGNFAQAGTFFDLANGRILSKNFSIDENGNARFKGNIEATGGKIGELDIDVTGFNVGGGGYDVFTLSKNGNDITFYVGSGGGSHTAFLAFDGTASQQLQLSKAYLPFVGANYQGYTLEQIIDDLDSRINNLGG